MRFRPQEKLSIRKKTKKYIPRFAFGIIICGTQIWEGIKQAAFQYMGVEPKIGVGPFLPPKSSHLFIGCSTIIFTIHFELEYRPYFWFNTHMDPFFFGG